MLKRLGFKHFAYDYRAEHVPTFDAEIDALKKHGIELTAWWFPQTLNAEARQIFDVLKRHEIKTQLWVTRRRGADEVDRGASGAGRSRGRPDPRRSPRKPRRSAAKSGSITTAAGSASRKTSLRSSKS